MFVFLGTVIIFVGFINGFFSSYEAPKVVYRAHNFDHNKLEGFMEFMKDTAQKWNLHMIELGPSLADENGFVIYLLYEEGDNEIFFMVSNIERFLSWTVYEHEKISEEDLERLIKEVKQGFESKFGLELFAHNPTTIFTINENGGLGGNLEYIHRLADWAFYIRILFTTRMHTFMSAIYCMR